MSEFEKFFASSARIASIFAPKPPFSTWKIKNIRLDFGLQTWVSNAIADVSELIFFSDTFKLSNKAKLNHLHKQNAE